MLKRSILQPLFKKVGNDMMKNTVFRLKVFKPDNKVQQSTNCDFWFQHFLLYIKKFHIFSLYLML